MPNGPPDAGRLAVRGSAGISAGAGMGGGRRVAVFGVAAAGRPGWCVTCCRNRASGGRWTTGGGAASTPLPWRRSSPSNRPRQDTHLLRLRSRRHERGRPGGARNLDVSWRAAGSGLESYRGAGGDLSVAGVAALATGRPRRARARRTGSRWARRCSSGARRRRFAVVLVRVGCVRVVPGAAERGSRAHMRARMALADHEVAAGPS